MTFLCHVLASLIIGATLFPYAAGRILRKVRNGYGDINRNFIIDAASIRLIAEAMKGERNDR